jgi:hypothetical protein
MKDRTTTEDKALGLAVAAIPAFTATQVGLYSTLMALGAGWTVTEAFTAGAIVASTTIGVASFLPASFFVAASAACLAIVQGQEFVEALSKKANSTAISDTPVGEQLRALDPGVITAVITTATVAATCFLGSRMFKSKNNSSAPQATATLEDGMRHKQS